MIKGITVNLHVKELNGYDPFGNPIYISNIVAIDNVLVTPKGTDDEVDGTNLNGKKIAYELCIPKGDSNNWENTTVDFFGKTWRTVGYPQEYIEDMLPLKWNKKVLVERNERS